MDITQFEAADTGFLHLKNPKTEEPMFEGAGDDKKPVGITFHAPGSQPYEAATARRTNRALSRSKKKIDLTADLLRADQVAWLVDVTVSFDNLTYPPAAEVKGEQLFAALYGDRKLGWATEQATAFMADWGNFTPNSATS